MLRKIDDGRATPDGSRREWFQSSDLDLYVWFNDAGQAVAFHLSYDKPHPEKVLVWRTGAPVRHYLVESGLNPGGHPRSPVLTNEVALSPNRLMKLFRAHSEGLPEALRRLVQNVLDACG